MNPGAVLALIGDLYAQLAALRAECEQLREALAERADAA